MADSGEALGKLDQTKSGTWVFQIFFGRYRPWGVRPEHFVILVTCLAIMIQVYIVLLQRRINRFHKARERVLSDPKLPLAQKDMSRKMYQFLLSELLKVDKIQAKHFPPDDSDVPGDPGWGVTNRIAFVRGEDGVFRWEEAGQGQTGPPKTIHFSSQIATRSVMYIEEKAEARRHGLSHKKRRTIREYMMSLPKIFPALSPSLCQQYIEIYERALYSSHKFSESEFRDFLLLVDRIVDSINEVSSMRRPVGPR